MQRTEVIAGIGIERPSGERLRKYVFRKAAFLFYLPPCGSIEIAQRSFQSRNTSTHEILRGGPAFVLRRGHHHSPIGLQFVAFRRLPGSLEHSFQTIVISLW